MDKKKIKINDAVKIGEYICVFLKLDGNDIQIVTKDERLLNLIGKEVLLGKEKGKDYKFEPVK